MILTICILNLIILLGLLFIGMALVRGVSILIEQNKAPVPPPPPANPDSGLIDVPNTRV